MCPSCLSTAAIVALSAVSAGSAGALASKLFGTGARTPDLRPWSLAAGASIWKSGGLPPLFQK
jgi:hypothetical protein